MHRWILGCVALAIAAPAAADNVAHCEVLVMEVIKDKDVNGQAEVATFAPAVNFIKSVYDEEDGHITHIGKLPIRALMCRRNDVLPAETDYALMATGIPFVLSQDFDSSDTDSLTIYWKDGAFKHIYKGYPLSDEAQSDLDARLANFSERGIVKVKADETPEEDPETTSKSESEASPKTEPETETKNDTDD